MYIRIVPNKGVCYESAHEYSLHFQIHLSTKDRQAGWTDAGGLLRPSNIQMGKTLRWHRANYGRLVNVVVFVTSWIVNLSQWPRRLRRWP